MDHDEPPTLCLRHLAGAPFINGVNGAHDRSRPVDSRSRTVRRRTDIKLTFFAQIAAKGKRAPDHGDLLSEAEYEKPLTEALPNADDKRVLSDIFKDKDRALQMNRRSASPTPSASKENP